MAWTLPVLCVMIMMQVPGDGYSGKNIELRKEISVNEVVIIGIDLAENHFFN